MRAHVGALVPAGALQEIGDEALGVPHVVTQQNARSGLGNL